jgi:hypothetical protein
MIFNVPTTVNDMGSHGVHTSIVFWPYDDGFLQPKHVVKILKYTYCQVADIYVVF